MNIIVCKDAAEAAKKAAVIFAAQITEKPASVLGLATGSTPLGLYEELKGMYSAGLLDFSRVKSFNLDEYVGLGENDEQSYRYFMDKNLFEKININPENTYVPNGLAKDIGNECKAYEEKIAAAGGIDLQLLGVGHNGHIAFNEPSDYFLEKTSLFKLNEETIEANSRFFASKDQVPQRSISMGIGSIMAAKKIVIMITGRGKREILSKFINSPVTPQIPVTVLKFHSNVTVIADMEAAEGINF